MNDLIGDPIILLFAFMVPILGLFAQECLSKKAISYLLFVSILLFVPVLIGYSYVVRNVNTPLVYIIATFGYGLIVSTMDLKIVATLIIAVLLLFMGGYLAFIGAMGGSITIEKEWKFEGYKIAYVKNHGFAGRPLMKYELNKYAVIPIFIRQVDDEIDNDTTGSCWVKFGKERLHFNKCETKSSYLVR